MPLLLPEQDPARLYRTRCRKGLSSLCFLTDPREVGQPAVEENSSPPRGKVNALPVRILAGRPQDRLVKGALRFVCCYDGRWDGRGCVHGAQKREIFFP